jgi:hypothetical protein
MILGIATLVVLLGLYLGLIALVSVVTKRKVGGLLGLVWYALRPRRDDPPPPPPPPNYKDRY